MTYQLIVHLHAGLHHPSRQRLLHKYRHTPAGFWGRLAPNWPTAHKADSAGTPMLPCHWPHPELAGALHIRDDQGGLVTSSRRQHMAQQGALQLGIAAQVGDDDEQQHHHRKAQSNWHGNDGGQQGCAQCWSACRTTHTAQTILPASGGDGLGGVGGGGWVGGTKPVVPHSCSLKAAAPRLSLTALRPEVMEVMAAANVQGRHSDASHHTPTYGHQGAETGADASARHGTYRDVTVVVTIGLPGGDAWLVKRLSRHPAKQACT
ncbi:hypothetical protein HaLaN_25948 [Haematococcus lacustris]|uniref:Uncharacterized protein n=1 Tax=Haematococcus lacustris TaxID=44745 RepID=A0A6A0A3B3_HAELA|nr:hypothetical protein HaLaN_25948 [Haematococcus lacustris]